MKKLKRTCHGIFVFAPVTWFFNITHDFFSVICSKHNIHLQILIKRVDTLIRYFRIFFN